MNLRKIFWITVTLSGVMGVGVGYLLVNLKETQPLEGPGSPNSSGAHMSTNLRSEHNHNNLIADPVKIMNSKLKEIETLGLLPNILSVIMVSIYDEHFNSHRGIDIGKELQSVGRKLFNQSDKTKNRHTITWQIVTKVLDQRQVRPDQWIFKAFELTYWIYKVESTFSKEQILRAYMVLNLTDSKGGSIVTLVRERFKRQSFIELSFIEAALIGLESTGIPTDKESPLIDTALMKLIGYLERKGVITNAQKEQALADLKTLYMAAN